MNNPRTWLSVAILSAIFVTNASAQTEIDKLRNCLTIDDGSKERLDCYDAARPKTKTAGCKEGCRLQIPERGGRAIGLFQSLCGPASGQSESCSKGRSKGSTAKMNSMVEMFQATGSYSEVSEMTASP